MFLDKKNIVLILKRSVFVFFLLIIACLYKCPFWMMLHIQCPGCGMTRAILSAIRLDFYNAFRYHSLFPIVILSVDYFIFREKLFIGKKREEIVLTFFLFLFILRWYIQIIM